MTRQQPLTLAIIISLSATLGACGGGGSTDSMPENNLTKSTPGVIEAEKNDETPPPKENNDTPPLPPETPTPSQATTPVAFSNAEQGLISLSTSRESNYTGIKNSFAVAPVSKQDRKLIDKVLAETNALRKKAGVKPLKYDENLAAFAQQRANEITQHYEHERPDGRKSLSNDILTFKEGGSAGENLYQSPRTPEGAVAGWKKSTGHYDNMVNPKYERIGIGLVRDPSSEWGYYWTQIFAGGDIGTKYHFDPKLAAARPEFQTYLANRVSENKTTGAITLVGGSSTSTNASKAYQQGKLNKAIYADSKSFSNGDFKAIIQNPANSGFSYQTFGEIVDKNNVPVQYVNIGQPTVPNDDVQFKATYHGSSLGNRNQRSHYYADVTATVDYGPNRKVMDIAFSNTRFAPNDIKDGNPGQKVWGLKADEHSKNYNFKERLEWSSKDERFDKTKDGNHIHAAFYGKHGEEIGGQFTRTISAHEIYEGVFGAKNNKDASD